jgi:hypothetical protein
MQANKIVSRIVLATIIWASAEARAADKMSVIDFLLDWKQYKNQRVTVTDCALLTLGETLIYCYPRGTLTSAVMIQGDTCLEMIARFCCRAALLFRSRTALVT